MPVILTNISHRDQDTAVSLITNRPQWHSCVYFARYFLGKRFLWFLLRIFFYTNLLVLVRSFIVDTFHYNALFYCSTVLSVDMCKMGCHVNFTYQGKISSLRILITSVTTECRGRKARILLPGRVVPGQSFGPETGYPNWGVPWFYSYPPENLVVVF